MSKIFHGGVSMYIYIRGCGCNCDSVAAWTCTADNTTSHLPSLPSFLVWAYQSNTTSWLVVSILGFSCQCNQTGFSCALMKHLL